MAKFRVTPKERGEKLLSFLRKYLTEAPSVKSIKKAIENRCCMINGQIERFSTRVLKEGDVVEIDLSRTPAKEQLLTVLYEDADLVICHKPSGLISTDAAFNKALPQYGHRLHLVHRLDKETTGVIVLARNVRMKEAMMELFAKREVKKQYLALVDGLVSREKGIIDTKLGKKFAYQGQTVYGSMEKGQRAVTPWKKLATGHQCTLLLCEPLTGRTHQLRVHLSEMGHPILGDTQYGKHFKCKLRPQRHLLHARGLAFVHPVTGEKLVVKAPLPEDFEEALRYSHISIKIEE